MKKILFNLLCAQPAFGSKFHGGGEYVKTVFEHLVKNHHNKDAIIVPFLDEERFLDEWIWNMIHEYDVEVINVKKEQDCVEIMKEHDFDVFYTGMSFIYDRDQIQKDIKTVCTVHDLRNYEEAIDSLAHIYYDSISEKIKQHGKYLLRQYLRERNLARYHDRLSVYDEFVCVSEHTQYMVKTALPEFGERANNVFYTPSKHYQLAREPENFDEENYILMVSANRWLKNCYRALLALDNLYSKGLIKNKTVLTGELPKSVISRLKNKEQFITLKYVDSDELEYLYSKCQLLLYPSLNEGFGMPPLEAMRYGKTCVVSGICSLVELYSGAVYFVNPYKIEEIENRVLMSLENPISEKVVLDRFDLITARQEQDLENLSRILIE